MDDTLGRVCDFSRSFASFTTLDRGNTARIQVEARCLFVDEGRPTQEFLLVASCKAEDTYSDGALFRQPSNYDFCALFGRDDFAILRAQLLRDDRYAEVGKVTERFAEVSLDLVYFDSPEELPTNRDIVQATLANRPLVGRTALTRPDGRLGAVLEYPIKTMNANAERELYQVDTGPVAFPDLALPPEERVRGLELAYVAFNRFDRAEFILQRPTPVEKGGEVAALVNHYSDVVTVQATNTVIAGT
jgi:hypothetical protein